MSNERTPLDNEYARATYEEIGRKRVAETMNIIANYAIKGAEYLRDKAASIMTPEQEKDRREIVDDMPQTD